MNIDIKKTMDAFHLYRYEYAQKFTMDFSIAPRPVHNLAFVLKGEGKVSSEGRKFDLKAGQLLFIPKGSTYLCEWESEEIIFHTVHFVFPAKFDPFHGKRIPVQAVEIDDFKENYSLMEYMQSYQNDEEKSFFVLSDFFRLCARVFPHIVFRKTDDIFEKIRPAIDILEDSYREKLSVDELAAACYLSPSRFYSLFKRATGVSPIVYKNGLCMSQALRELTSEPNKSVEQIAFELGFESVVYFRRLFKKTTGKTPLEYKRTGNCL